jgi:hypothetical protein
MRQLIEPDEQKLRALILVDIVFVAAISKPGRRAVMPRDNVFRFVVAAVQRAWNIAPKVGE